MTPPLGTIRVLVVDDQETDARLLVRELRRGGFEVESKRVDEEATLREALAEHWDIVLADWSMPRFSGLEALAIVRDLAGDLPFILVSGAIGEELAIEAMRSGADDIILKDRLARLQPAVTRELRDAAGRAELRAAEAQLRKSEDIISRSEKLTALGQMAAGISHDLRNLLNPLSLEVQVALRACTRGDLASAKEALEEMREHLVRGVETIDSLRDYGRERQQRESALDVNALVKAGVDVARARQLSAGYRLVKIETDYGTPPPIDGVAGDIVNAVVNLVVNAIDAMRDSGGTVTVRTRDLDRSAVIEVVDDGPGMPPDVERRAFEPFFTTKGEHGTGLGLAMVANAVKRHGGTVSLETREGGGTKLRLVLPGSRGGSRMSL